MTPSALRVRFAPSPTGYLHVGGVRTALFNWLYARKAGGQFLLRIEDTDRERSSDEHTRVILDGLRWLGLEWDEDVMFQGQGVERHRAVAMGLLDGGHAYEDGGAIWFRMPHETIAWDDFVHGAISFQGADIPDWAILRSDGTPTYNLSVVADDVEMAISHVMRGDDHISNTPKQIAVYRALGVEPPAFGHVPNVLGTDGKKLSKRHGATAVGDYRDMGFLPAAMRNFLALIGWNPKTEQELFFTTDELVAAFTLEDVQKKSGVFDLKKLEWMNGQHISRMDPPDLLALVEGDIGEVAAPGETPDRERLLAIVAAVRHRARRTGDVVRQVGVRINDARIERDAKAEAMLANDLAGFRHALAAAAERLGALDDAAWTPESLEAALRALAEELELGLGKVMQPIRVALTGGTVSEPVNELLWLVGKDASLRRMSAAGDWTPA